MRKAFTLFALLLALLSMQASAQDRKISGKVTSSEDNLGIPGVTIEVKGTTIATSTDLDGNYTINIPSTTKALRFSAIGMKPYDIEVTASTTVDLVMEPDLIKLHEVVVTALGIEREKRSLGYSTTEVKGDNLTKSNEVNLTSSLSGKVAGIQVTSSAGVPGASSKVLLRGVRSFISDNQPLYVIDGVPLDNSTNAVSGKDYPFNNNLEQVNYSNRAIDISPDDIESINVLKGPAAAIMYGERGANGAIIITSKRGKYGQKTAVSFTSSYQIDDVNKLPELQSTYAQGSGGGRIGGTPTYNTYSAGADGIWGTGDDKAGTANSWGPKISDLGLSSYDNPDNFFKTGSTWTNSVSITSGTEKNAYRLSISNTDQEGIIPNTDFKRLSLHATSQSQLAQTLSISTSTNVIFSNGFKAQQGSNLSGVMLGLLRAPASYDLRTGEGSGWERADGTFYNYFRNYDNPYWSAYNNTFHDETTRLLANIALNYYPKDWLKLTWRPGIDTYGTNSKNIYAIGSHNSTQNNLGQVGLDNAYHQELSNNLIATINRELTSDISGTLTVGNSISQRIDNDQYSRGRNLAIAKFYNVGNASDLYGDETKVRKRSAAFYATLDFSWKSIVFLGLQARQEWSSAFGKNKRSFFYPGANAAFVFTELGSLKDNKVLSFGKIRLAYATSANSPLAYSSVSTYSKPFFTDGFTNGFAFPYLEQNGYGTSGTIGNPNLEPEQTKGPELGLELRFLQDRISLDLTYYNQETSNVLLSRPIPYSTGHAAILDNAGVIVNKGIEIEANFIPIKTKDFEWQIGGNFAQNKNTVKELANGIDQVEIEVGFGDPGVFAKIGEPFGVLYGTTWERASDGQLLIGADGLPIASLEVSKVGNPFPDWTAGIRTEFTYKKLSLSALLDIKKGSVIWNGTQARLNRIGRSLGSADREKTYVISGTHADGSANSTPVDAIDYWQVYKGDFGATEESVQDGGWTRLRELTLSYTINKIKVFKNIQLSVSARNLWLKTDYTGVDPETSLTGAGSNYTGIDWFVMPNTKSYNFTVKANF